MRKKKAAWTKVKRARKPTTKAREPETEVKCLGTFVHMKRARFKVRAVEGETPFEYEVLGTLSAHRVETSPDEWTTLELTFACHEIIITYPAARASYGPE